ncbi:MAG: hypothetical protein U1F83_11410 [Verrucomicrobiota bacterium]
MKNRKSRLGLAILAGGLSFVGSASAIDIVIDGSYESSTNNLSGIVGSGGDSGAGIDGGWTAFTTYTYSAGYTQTGPTGSGQVYLRPYSPNQIVSQINSLTRAITTAQIDGSQGQYNVSAWFSTYHGQNDWSDLTLQFLDVSQAPIGNPVALGGLTFVTALPGGSGNRAWGKDTKIGLIPPGARYASITTESHLNGSGLPDGYVDLVSLDVTAGFLPVQITSASPATNATGVGPNAVLSVSIQDGTAALNTSSVLMWFDGSPVSPTIQKPGAATSVTFDPPGLLASQSVHTYAVAFNNTGGAIANTTNQYAFTVAPWVNINLGAPVYLETFDGVAEGVLPSGWTPQNFTDLDSVPGNDLNNFHSDSFLDWTTVSRSTVSNWFAVTPDGGDFVSIFNVAPNQVINNAVVTNLISTNFIIAVSDRTSDSQKQIQYLFTSDYNLSGQNNVYLAFDSIWVQNQDSMAAVEYSINGGTTWLPVQYMLDGGDILRDASGSIDASNTFATVHADVPTTLATTGGNYGLFIGVAQNQWASLAPYLSARGDDNQTASKKLEIIRLPQADNQPAVRFRLANEGSYSWYWAIDNFGLYSLPTVPAPVLATGPTPAVQTVAVGNAVSLTIADAIGVSPMSYQWRHYGTNLPGKTGLTLVFSAAQPSDAGPYDVVATNPGGSVTSAPPAAVLTVINPSVLVSGQWNFETGLGAFVGRALEYNDATVQADTTFGTTTSFGIPDINGQPATVMHFTPSATSWGGYKMYHQTPPNGGGAYVTQYTLIYDLYLPFTTWRSLLQTGVANTSDGDIFINPSSGVGISSVYNGNVTAGEWHRVAVAMDLTGPGSPVLTKFVDGIKVGNQTSGLSAVDGRFALDVYALLFGDQDGDVAETFVSCVQFSNGRRPDAFIAALGGASAAKIPGAIKATLAGGSPVIHWTGGVPLQSADSPSGPWTTLGVSSPYTPPAGSAAKFYRPKIP